MHPGHGRRDRRQREGGGAADRVFEDEALGRDHHADDRGDQRGGAEPGRRPGQQLEQDDHQEIAGGGAEQRHVGDVEAERGEPAVGEEQALHDQHRGDGQRADPGADQDDGEGAAEQVTRDAGQHLEVEHLHREDERRDQARHRREPIVEVGPGPPHAEGERRDGEDREHRGHRPVDDPVGDVHRLRIHACLLSASEASI
jgi:hypothetical protein